MRAASQVASQSPLLLRCGNMGPRQGSACWHQMHSSLGFPRHKPLRRLGSPGTAWSAAPPPGTVCKGSCGCAHCGGLQLHTVAACASGWEIAGAPGEAWVGVERNPISRITSPATPREIAGLGTEPGFPGHKSLNPWEQAQREKATEILFQDKEQLRN